MYCLSECKRSIEKLAKNVIFIQRSWLEKNTYVCVSTCVCDQRIEGKQEGATEG